MTIIDNAFLREENAILRAAIEKIGNNAVDMLYALTHITGPDCRESEMFAASVPRLVASLREAGYVDTRMSVGPDGAITETPEDPA